MANSDNIEEIIQLIAARHGITVGRDDPILVLHTMNERLQQESLLAQQALLDQFKSELEVIAHQWELEAKGKAERTLNAALVVSQDVMAQELKTGASVIVQSWRRELDDYSASLAASLKGARRVAMLNMLAAALAVLAALLAVWAIA
ncbi:MAG: hypothetical protein ACRCZA_04445 [Shewanella sp.]|uniref:hypothetical protein n=1 Tax=Shewanella sp. TaxID=50422 RepID=UPI003F301BF9